MTNWKPKGCFFVLFFLNCRCAVNQDWIYFAFKDTPSDQAGFRAISWDSHQKSSVSPSCLIRHFETYTIHSKKHSIRFSICQQQKKEEEKHYDLYILQKFLWQAKIHQLTLWKSLFCHLRRVYKRIIKSFFQYLEIFVQKPEILCKISVQNPGIMVYKCFILW